MEHTLINQELVYTTLNQVIQDPPHIFLTGPYGYGKSSIATAFLEAYFKQFGIDPTDPEWVFYLSSDSDRGIHRVREGVAEFVRHTSLRKGVYRWILVDDSDTLPIVSQQALRRPMETHAHTTRFLFCSRHVSDLIAPLRSRCLHVEIETISLNDLLETLTHKYEIKKTLSEKTRQFLLTMSLSPRHLIYYMKCIACLGDSFNEEKFRVMFSGVSDERIRKLILSFLRKEKQQVFELLFDIWNSGISYEDFLTDMSRCSKNMGYLPPIQDQKLHEIMIQGWIYYTHGRTHLLDILSLFKDVFSEEGK